MCLKVVPTFFFNRTFYLFISFTRLHAFKRFEHAYRQDMNNNNKERPKVVSVYVYVDAVVNFLLFMFQVVCPIQVTHNSHK